MSEWKRIKKTDEDSVQAEPSKKSKEPAIEFFPEEPKYSFDEVILPQAVKEKILDVANYAENSKKVFEEWGLQKVYKQSKRIGINLYGAPGTGKTMAAHAIAKHLGRKILIVNYADIESKYVGETPKNIRRAFEAAKKSNSILFFDEADAILSKRVTGMQSAHDVSVNQTRSVMLMLMNDYQDFVIFATNFIENFDPAFMRRISTHIEFKLPDFECRKKLWQHYILPTMPNNIDIDELAEKFDGISGSDIANAVLMAAFKAARQNSEIVDKKFVFEIVHEIIASKNANRGVIVTERKVSEAYVKKQIKKHRRRI
ncbi:MAG: ATP-binding protein [Selenomonadaceae bacterium]|nr:ATP-binding protein [Selenomonadaceae bacterium]